FAPFVLFTLFALILPTPDWPPARPAPDARSPAAQFETPPTPAAGATPQSAPHCGRPRFRSRRASRPAVAPAPPGFDRALPEGCRCSLVLGCRLSVVGFGGASN